MKIFGKNGKMKINEFIQKYRKVKKLDWPAFRGFPGMTSSHTPYVVCKDGFKMSVQAGQSLYSEPRDVADSYEEAEVGFPSTEETLLTSYAEDNENLCDTVYGYVPCSIIDQVIEKHGGIDESKIKEIS
jgi:translation initiation factor 2B subunit (eIF-2B alpha/beta/delta family)